MLKTILFLGTIFSLLGCSTIYYMVPQKEENQDLLYVAGQTGVSESFINDDYELIAVELYSEVTEKYITLWVTYINYTRKSLNVYPDRITVKGITGDMVFDLEVWNTRKAIKRATSNISLGLLAGIVAGQLDENYNYATEKYLQNEYNQKASYLNSVLLTRTTIDPAHYKHGAVMINKVPCKEYIVTVPFGENDFVFTFDKGNY